MRAFTQVQVDGDIIFALDEDGVLWRGQIIRRGDPGQQDRPIEFDHTGAIQCRWRPLTAPPDDPPFMDTRDKLTRLEDRIRQDVAERDALRERFDSLPPIKDTAT